MSKKPKPKVAAGGIGGAVATIVIALFPDVSPELAAAIATVVSFVAGYIWPE